MKSKVKIAAFAAVITIAIAAWGETETANGYTWTYRIVDGNAEIYNEGNCAVSPEPDGDVAIPPMLGGKPVTSIGSSAFYDCWNLKSVSFPDSVTKIGYLAFFYCSSLTNMTIPAGVTAIESQAFYHCDSLLDVKLPNSITRIDHYAFGNCSSLTNIAISSSVNEIDVTAFDGCNSLTTITVSDDNQYYSNRNGLLCDKDGTTVLTCPRGLTNVMMPEGVTTIGRDAFMGCASLTDISIPESVETIGRYAFMGCDGLASNGFIIVRGILFEYIGFETNITIPTSVTEIGDSAFYYNTVITGVTIPESVTIVDDAAFRDCTDLENIVVPGSVKTIGWGAFYGCSSLTNVTISSGVKSIGDFAFADCGALTKIDIPDSVTDIGGGAFRGCDSLIAFAVSSDSQNFCVSNGLLCNKAATKVIACPASMANVTIPDSVREIGDEAFAGGMLSEITMPEGLSSIGWGAFNRCDDLTSIEIPEGVTYISMYCFAGCENLSSVLLPSSVTAIGAEAFYGCALREITIPRNVQNIEWSAFANCTNLVSASLPNTLDGNLDDSIFEGCSPDLAIIYYNGATPTATTTFTYTLSNGEATITGAGNITSVLDIPATIEGFPVTAIGESAFMNDQSVESLIIPDCVTSIGWGAFLGCSGLTSVTIGGGVTSIGYSAFSCCSGLTSVAIGNSVTSIGGYAFCDCSGLTSVTIPDSVMSIGFSAFSGCSSLTNVVLGCSVTSIEDSAFESCSGLTSVTIPDSVTSMGIGVFYGCGGLTRVTLPNGVTAIADSAFSWCTNLTGITIPNSVTSIGDWAFYNCSSLTDLTIPNNVTNIGYSAFAWCSNLIGSLAIPDGVTSIADYTFYGCSGLMGVTMPNGVTSIGGAAFGDCNGLTEVAIPNSVTIIGQCAFSGCSGLDSLTIPDSVMSIDDGAFQYCDKLTNVVILNGVTNIGDWAFCYCSSLACVVIPSSVTNIGNGAFCNCVSMNKAYLPEHLEGKIDNSVFQDNPPNLEIIYYNGATPTATTTFTYTLSNGEATITGASNITSVLDIPATIDGYPVVAIGERAFIQGKSIERLIIPNGVTNIGEWAFFNCDKLREVIVPDSVVDIGTFAFNDCSALTSVSIGSGLKKIQNWTFGVCSNLVNLSIADGVEAIGTYAFGFCDSLECIIIPRSVTNIHWGAFGEISALQTAYLPNSLEGRNLSGAFYNSPNVMVLYYNCETPGAPSVSSFSATEDWHGVVCVSWDVDFDSELSCYKVYRAMDDDFSKAELVAELSDIYSTMYNDYNVLAHTNYYYWVVAVNDIFESPPLDSVVGRCEEPRTFYVDAYTGDDMNDGLSAETALASVNYAIYNADPYSTIYVAPGTYYGGLVLDKPIFLETTNGAATIDAVGMEHCVRYERCDYCGSGGDFSGRPVIRGFILKNGYEAAAHVTLERCVVTGNSMDWVELDAESGEEYGLYFGESSNHGVLYDCAMTNCTIAGNVTIPNRHTLMTNCTYNASTIVWGNGDGADEAVDPVFVAMGNGDCRLREASPYAVNGVATRGAFDEVVTGYIIVATVEGPGSLDKSVVAVEGGGSVTFTAVAGSHPLDHFEVNGEPVESSGNSYTFSNVMADATLKAVFVSNATFYVDAVNGSDSNYGFTKVTAIATLQEAVSRSENGDTIIVADGVYAPIMTRNRRIVIESENGYRNAIIDGGFTNNCALLGGEESYRKEEPMPYGGLWQGTNTVLRGFTLRNGHAAWGAGVTAGTVEKCLIVGNVVEARPMASPGPNGLGGGAYLSVLNNCTLVGNASIPAISADNEKYGGVGGGSWGCTLFNCIEWDNEEDPGEIGSDFGDWWNASVYVDSCCEDPLFVDAANGDYRLFASSWWVVGGVVTVGCESEAVFTGKPDAPVWKLVSQGITTDGVHLSWFGEGTQAVSWDIYRSSTDDYDWMANPIAHVSDASYIDTTAERGVHYWYWLEARNKKGRSDESELAEGWCVTKENLPKPYEPNSPYLGEFLDWLQDYELVEMANELSDNELVSVATNLTRKGYPLWHDFVVGTDPTVPGDDFKVSISFTNGVPCITWTPDISGWRDYTIMAKERLEDKEWKPWDMVIDARFFKVEVSLPEGIPEPRPYSMQNL